MLLRSLLCLCLAGGVAAAEGPDEAQRRAAREHYQKGTTAYDLGRYDLAIAEYEAAYAAVNEPTLLYNLGQANRLARHTEQALHFYKMYLSKVPDAPNRAEVESKIAALNVALAEEAKARNIPPDQTIKPPPDTMPPATTTTTTTQLQPTPTPAPAVQAAPSRRGRTLEIAGITVGAAGLGLVVGGIVAGVLAKSAADDISRANANHQPFDPNKYSTYQNDQIAAAALIGVGAAALIAGTAVAIVGARRNRPAMALQLTPQVAPQRAGIAATLHF